MSTNNTLWDRVCTTDFDYTKKFQGKGGFSGTAINATWLVREASKVFGPCGIGWGFSVVDEKYVPGKPGDVVHVVRLQLWYMHEGQRGVVEQYGQTAMVGTQSKGAFTDEEAPKKSITDAMSKCLSLLGFGSDIHLGLYDDNKYVNDRQREAGISDREAPVEKPKPATSKPAPAAKTETRTRPAADAPPSLVDIAIGELAAVTSDEDFVGWFASHMRLLVDVKGDDRKRIGAASNARGKALNFEPRDLRAFYDAATQQVSQRKVA